MITGNSEKRVKLSGASEMDVFTKGLKRWIRCGPGEKRFCKAAYRKRVRRKARADLKSL